MTFLNPHRTEDDKMRRRLEAIVEGEAQRLEGESRPVRCECDCHDDRKEAA